MILLCRDMLRKIHWECVICRSFEMYCFAQSALLAGHGEVKILYCVEMGQNIPSHEVAIANDILTLG